MMDDLRNLYQEVIFDHNRNPRNYGKLENPNRTAQGYNPLCGDQLKLYMELGDDGRIADVSFEGNGCAISTASASIMTSIIKGKTAEEAQVYFDSFHGMVTGEGDGDDSLEDFDKLRVLGGVAEYPSRVKCATLAWHTVRAAIDDSEDPVTTE